VGINYKIQEIQGEESIVQRLYELGFIKGRLFEILHKTPFNGPFVVEIQGTTVALRKEEIQCIQTL